MGEPNHGIFDGETLGRVRGGVRRFFHVAGFRWALLGGYLADVEPPGALFPISIAITVVVLLSGLVFFRTTERSFADVI